MVQRKDEPEQGTTLTGETNGQAFPAEVVPDPAAQQDNAKRVAAAKDADAKRQLLPAQADALDKEPTKLTSPTGTVVTADSEALVTSLKAAGYK